MNVLLLTETCQAHNLPVRSQRDCLLPLDPGSCDMEIMQMYYDAASMSCKEFLFSGCGGNTNRFASFVQCQITCEGVRPPQPDLDRQPLQETGARQPDSGVVWVVYNK